MLRFIVFFLIFSLEGLGKGPLHIAMIDTAVCSDSFANIILKGQTLKKGCKTHGQKILRYLDRNLKKTIQVTSFSIFSKEGHQSKKLWLDSLDAYSKTPVDLTLVAVGYVYEKSYDDLKTLFLKNRSLKFVASGQKGRGIELNMKLFPQELFSEENVILVGAYHKLRNAQKYVPKSQMYGHAIELLKPISHSNLVSGSSQASADALLAKIHQLQ